MQGAARQGVGELVLGDERPERGVGRDQRDVGGMADVVGLQRGAIAAVDETAPRGGRSRRRMERRVHFDASLSISTKCDRPVPSASQLLRMAMTAGRGGGRLGGGRRRGGWWWSGPFLGLLVTTGRPAAPRAQGHGPKAHGTAETLCHRISPDQTVPAGLLALGSAAASRPSRRGGPHQWPGSRPSRRRPRLQRRVRHGVSPCSGMLELKAPANLARLAASIVTIGT